MPGWALAGSRKMITVNQRDRVVWHRGMTISDLLMHLRYTFPQIVVSIDGDVVPHDAYDGTQIPDCADVRIIHLMAGG